MTLSTQGRRLTPGALLFFRDRLRNGSPSGGGRTGTRRQSIHLFNSLGLLPFGGGPDFCTRLAAGRPLGRAPEGLTGIYLKSRPDDPGRVLPVGDRKVGISMPHQHNDPDYLQGQLQVWKLFAELAADKIGHGERLGLKGILRHHLHHTASVRADQPLLFEGVEAAVTELTRRLDDLVAPTMSRPRGRY